MPGPEIAWAAKSIGVAKRKLVLSVSLPRFSLFFPRFFLRSGKRVFRSLLRVWHPFFATRCKIISCKDAKDRDQDIQLSRCLQPTCGAVPGRVIMNLRERCVVLYRLPIQRSTQQPPERDVTLSKSLPAPIRGKTLQELNSLREKLRRG